MKLSPDSCISKAAMVRVGGDTATAQMKIPLLFNLLICPYSPFLLSDPILKTKQQTFELPEQPLCHSAMRLHPIRVEALFLLNFFSLTFAKFDKTEAVNNANHIFNSIYSATRLWESRTNSKGMSFFLASIPKGTHLYHGSGSKEPRQGMEWLGFEPELALYFSHQSGSRESRQRDSYLDRSAQQPLSESQDVTSKMAPAYLHTYLAARDLRLLYIDGLTGNLEGEADSQDRILFNDTIDYERKVGDPNLGGSPQEQQRAIELCRMIKEDWNDRIDGVVRIDDSKMINEMWLELILCSFERDLKLDYITQTKPQEKNLPGLSLREPDDQREDEDFATLQDIPGHDPNIDLTRFYRRLGQRVRVDFDNFVSAYVYDIDLFPNNSSQPQLRHIPLDKLYPIRQDITSLINNHEPSSNAVDWQAIADTIVFQYSDELHTLAAGNFSSLQSLRDKVEALLEPFIDYGKLSSSQIVIDRCADEWIPSTASRDSLGGRAVRSIAQRICYTLTSALINNSKDLEIVVTSFEDLVSYLQWTTPRTPL